MRVHIKPNHGPQKDFGIEEVNAMLARGELDGDELAWRPGLSDWTRLRAIDGIQVPTPPPLDLLRADAPDSTPDPPPLPDAESSPRTPPASEVDPIPVDESKTFWGGTLHPWRRFFARTLDLVVPGLMVFIGATFFVGLMFPANLADLVKAVENPVIAGIVLYVLWLPIEALFLALSGTTPAKWLFGIKVLDASGSRLTFGDALQRSSLVWFHGDGLGIPLVNVYTRFNAYRRLVKTRTTLWDESVNSVVIHRQWGFFRALVCTVAVIVALMFLAVLNAMNTQY